MRASIPFVLSVVCLMGVQGCQSEARTSAHLQPPEGYRLAAAPAKGGPRECPKTPEPYTGELLFPSKYAGSDAARDKINPQAATRYRDLTGQVQLLESGTSRLVARYLKYGQDSDVECVLGWLQNWAEQDALTSTSFNHTGKSVRKWALASVSGSYLRLKFSNSHPLAAHAEQTRVIEAWLGRLADQVVKDWNAQPMDRRNNHQYWAAWAVMSTAVVLDRRDLFDWSVAQYRHGIDQIDAEGYLPLELKRQTRALAYHNYAMGPLTMIAAFAKANGEDLRDENDKGLQRLATRLEVGVHQPKVFQEKTGYEQVMVDLQPNNRFSWLEPYCALYSCSEKTNAWRRSKEPMNTYRLGGDLTQLFEGQLP
ncbi:mannuronate-specific alginate lyase [Pseudomonas sp. LRF_L74]|uniref:mannuronate-specific alginate lyase n=1 Tax=Pseudomonas sp. LRF_L74 TaxID=3369422 RepID=UPI003F600D70